MKWVDPRANRAILLFHGLFVMIYVSTAFWPLSASVKKSVLGAAYMMPPILAVAGTTTVYFMIKDRKRLFWGFLALAMIALCAGELYWSSLQIFQGMDQPPPESFATFSYLTGYMFLFLAMFLLWWLTFKKVNWLYGVLTTSILMVTLSAAFWFLQLETVYGPVLRAGRYKELINGIYPILDIALVVGFIGAAVFSNVANWAPWITAIVVGIALYAVADIGFTYFALADAYEPGTLVSNLLDVFWMACYMLVFYGTYLRLRAKASPRVQRI